MRRRFHIVALLAALAVAASGCAPNNAAAPTGWVDHINDGHEDGGM